MTLPLINEVEQLEEALKYCHDDKAAMQNQIDLLVVKFEALI